MKKNELILICEIIPNTYKITYLEFKHYHCRTKKPIYSITLQSNSSLGEKILGFKIENINFKNREINGILTIDK
jgi:hypothetical protein